MTETVRSVVRQVDVGALVNPITLTGIYCESASDLAVYADSTLLTLGTDYSVDNLNDADGPEVTITDPSDWTAFEVFTVVHAPSITQNSDLSLGGAFGTAYEAGLDRLARLLRVAQNAADRSVKLPPWAVAGETGPYAERLEEDHFWIADADGNMVDGGSGADIGNAAVYAAQVAADKATVAADKAIVEGYKDEAAASAAQTRLPTIGSQYDTKTIYYNHTAQGYEFGDGRRIYDVAEQQFASVADRLRAALEAANGRHSTVVIGELNATADRGSGSDFAIRSETKLVGKGMTIKGAAAAGAALKAYSDQHNIHIEDVTFDANSGPGWLSTGAIGLTFERVAMLNWSGYGFNIRSGLINAGRASKGIWLNHVRMEKPVAGVLFPVLISRGIGGYRVEDVMVSGFRGWGTDRLNPAYGDYSAVNEFTADFITLQGVLRGTITDWEVHYSGSALVTAARGCEDITVSHGFGEVSMEAMNLGAGNRFVHVDNIANFYATTSTGTLSSTGSAITSSQIEAVTPDPTGTGGWLELYSDNGGVISVGDVFTQTGGAGSAVGTVNVAPSGAFEAGRYVIHSLYGSRWYNNRLHDVGMRFGVSGALIAAFQCQRARGPNYVHGNFCSRPQGLGGEDYFLRASNSDIGYGLNTWNGRRAMRGAYNNPGGTGTFLYQDDHRGGLFAKARAASSGTLTNSYGLTCVKNGGAAGTYDYTIDAKFAPPDNGYQVRVGFVNSDRQGYITYTDATHFTVTCRKVTDGTVVDSAHDVIVEY